MNAIENFIFTSESVSEGHPDKICDRVSDRLVDLYIKADPEARTAIETVCTKNYVGVIGETRCKDNITKDAIEHEVRQAIKAIGYEQDTFHWKNVEVDIRTHNQSVDIAVGVDEAGDKEEGAGDQGIMFGYATDETKAYMPATLQYAQDILRKLSDARHAGIEKDLGPDAKSQVTLEYVNGRPVRADSVVVSTQHSDGLSQSDVKEIVRPYVEKVLPDGWMPEEDKFYVNPTGRFVIGGPVGDAGLTGRKIIVDTYGGAAPHGGGAFSGKDPTKVDRSAAYAARYVAKNIVAAGMAKKCIIQLSYAIGVARPLSIYVNTMGTGTVEENLIAQAIDKVIDLSPKGIRNHLNLNKPIYEVTSSYGHFGRKPREDGSFSWEKLDLIDALKKAI